MAASYNKAKSAVLFNGSTADWFRATVGVHQGCLFSPNLYIFLERIMSDALEYHMGSVSIGGRIFIQMTLLLMLKRKKMLLAL